MTASTCCITFFGFLFHSEIIFRTTRELEHLFFFVAHSAKFFFQNLTLGYMTKISESNYFFSPPPKSEYFFQQHWESEYIFLEKTITPLPCKLNGPSLTVAN